MTCARERVPELGRERNRGKGEEAHAAWSCTEGSGARGADRSKSKEEESDYTEGLRVLSGKG